MTLIEFGDFLKTQFPGNDDAPSEALALQFLRQYPQYRDFVGASTDRIQQLVSQKAGFFGRPKSERDMAVWKNRAESASAIQNIQLNYEASLRGVDVPTLMQMRLTTHETDEQVRLLVHQANEQIRVATNQTSQQIRLTRQTAAIETKRKFKEAFYKLKLAYREWSLRQRMTLEAAISQGGGHGRQPRQLRERTVPKDHGEEMG